MTYNSDIGYIWSSRRKLKITTDHHTCCTYRKSKLHIDIIEHNIRYNILWYEQDIFCGLFKSKSFSEDSIFYLNEINT